jgi:hypothetical protein
VFISKILSMLDKISQSGIIIVRMKVLAAEVWRALLALSGGTAFNLLTRERVSSSARVCN